MKRKIFLILQLADRFTRKSYKAVNKMDKVKLIRMPQRSGLMRTRMAGVEAASAEVLTFLDSHVEATEGWLEPLMERIRLNPKAVPCPVIEEVNDKTFQYKAGNNSRVLFILLIISIRQ